MISQLLRDGCVKLFEKDSEQRQRTTGEMNAIYDLLCLTLTRRQQYGLFLEVGYAIIDLRLFNLDFPRARVKKWPRFLPWYNVTLTSFYNRLVLSWPNFTVTSFLPWPYFR